MRHALAGDGRRPVAAADHADVEVDRVRIGGVERRLDVVELLPPAPAAPRSRGTTPRSRSRRRARRRRAPGSPATWTWNQSTPTCAFQIAPRVGSVRIAASAVWPASTHASAPLPVHSSSTTDWSWTRPRGASPSRRSPRHGADDRDQARLHVARAAPSDPVAVAPRRERRAAPERHRLGADDVDVAVQDQRSPAARTPPAPSSRARSPCPTRPSRTARRPGGRRARRGRSARRTARAPARRTRAA